MFDLEGIDELEHSFDVAALGLANGVWRAVEIGAVEGIAYAKGNHRYKDQTGKLTASLHATTSIRTHGGATVDLCADAKYASFVEDGTRPHEIWPKAARGSYGPLRSGQSRGRGKGGGMLAWQHPQGDWHFARMVHHPGTKPYGFMGDAYLKCEAVIIREIEVSFATCVARFGP